ncbi:uncharacterized protein TNCV_4110881 [Trichonephila clavipes]|nr:uncharacterized protein TNCV_4110881 [Trichonephila clavipes]
MSERAFRHDGEIRENRTARRSSWKRTKENQHSRINIAVIEDIATAVVEANRQSLTSLNSVQQLKPHNPDIRKTFTLEFLARMVVDDSWPWNLLWMDEAYFHLNRQCEDDNTRAGGFNGFKTRTHVTGRKFGAITTRLPRSPPALISTLQLTEARTGVSFRSQQLHFTLLVKAAYPFVPSARFTT